MINMFEVNETNKMIEQENLDVRTITLGISLLDCCDTDIEKVKSKIYSKITSLARDLVKTGFFLIRFNIVFFAGGKIKRFAGMDDIRSCTIVQTDTAA